MRDRPILLVFLLILAFTFLLAGCAGAQPSSADPEPTDQGAGPGPSATEEPPILPPSQPTSNPSIETPDRTEQRPSQTLPAGLAPIEPPNLQPLVGEVPEELLEEIIADLVKRTGAERGDIQVVRAEAVVWNDGSLGCPKNGEFYIQILVNGYWVVLQVQGIAYDYRASGSEHFILCE